MVSKNLLDIDSLTIAEIEEIFAIADYYKAQTDSFCKEGVLKNKILINVFFENSTRTYTSFELAAKLLGAEVINFGITSSSAKKGEGDLDTIQTIDAMSPDFVTIRHYCSGYIYKLAKFIKGRVINAGDGCHAHPTQALLDSYTILKNKNTIQGQNVLICGDILHSRVARSNISLLKKLGANVSIVAPMSLIPQASYSDPTVRIFYNLKDAVQNQDVIMVLRLQFERMTGVYFSSLQEYRRNYTITEDLLSYCQGDVIILHPGPINRDLEISNNILSNHSISKALEQVKNGVLIRKAILNYLN